MTSTAALRRRPLTQAELRMDVRLAKAELQQAKEKLAAAIEAEKRRAIGAKARGAVGRLQVTQEMIDALDWIYDRGVDHAVQELHQIGVGTVRVYAESANQRVARLAMKRLTPMLGGITVRIDQEAHGLSLGQMAHVEFVNRLAKTVPGPLDAASRIVSSGFTAGLADTFEGVEHDVAGWQYTAIMDDNVCEECEANDGDEYETLDDAFAVLPDFGPNPDCYGEGRCRCRLVPTGAAEGGGGGQGPMAAPPATDPTLAAMSPQEDWKYLPAHSQQPIEQLTLAQAKDQRTRLLKYVRPLRGHVKAGTRNVHPEKIPALERRIKALDHYIKTANPDAGAAARVEEASTRHPALRPALASPEEVKEANRLRLEAARFIDKSGIGATKAKQEIQRDIASRLRNHPVFTRSVTPPRTAAPVRERLSQYTPGEQVELPVYPGTVYRVIGPAADRVAVEVVSSPDASLVGKRLEIHGGRRAVLHGTVKRPDDVPLFKHQLPRFKEYRAPGDTAPTDDHSEVVGGLISRWAATSGDNDAFAIAIQRAVKDEFGLSDRTMEHFMGRGSLAQADEIYAEHGEALRAFVRAMYDNTQEKLRARGIDEIVVYRGQGDLDLDVGTHLSAAMRLQPASSFSTSFTTSRSFIRARGGMIAVRVRADRILGSARTGFGCLNEEEYVLLGSPEGTDAATIVRAESVSNYNQDDYWGKVVEEFHKVRLSTTREPTPPRVPTVKQQTEQSLLVSKQDMQDMMGAFFSENQTDVLWDVLKVYENANTDVAIELSEAMDDLSNIDPELLAVLKNSGAVKNIYVGMQPVSAQDDLGALAGLKPSTWQTGTWDTAAGVYDNGQIAVNLSQQSGTVSPILHEIGHAIGAESNLDTSAPMQALLHSLQPKLPPHLQNTHELFAEGCAAYMKLGYPGVAKMFNADFADFLSEAVFGE